RVRRLREAVGPEISLRVDANQGWDRATALQAIRALEPYRLDFVEQPVPRWDGEGMAEIARAVTVPVMADESCCSIHDALAIARSLALAGPGSAVGMEEGGWRGGSGRRWAGPPLLRKNRLHPRLASPAAKDA